MIFNRRLGMVTVVGLTMWVGYAVLSTIWHGGTARGLAPYVYAPLLVIAGAVLGQYLTERLSPRSLAVLVGTAAALVALAPLTTDHPGRGAIGYANANAALGLQTTALAGVLVLDRRARAPALIAFGLGVAAVLANGSQAGNALLVALLAVVALASVCTRAHRRWPAAALSIISVSVAGMGLVALARSVVWPEALLNALDPVRRVLWLQAWGAFRKSELTGWGPGSFEGLNILAHDPDQASAHSLPLTVAVELGVIGLAALGVLFLIGLFVAQRSPSVPVSWIAITAWTILMLHAMIDHLLEYWPIPLFAGLVLGVGMQSQPDAEVQDESVQLLGARARRP